MIMLGTSLLVILGISGLLLLKQFRVLRLASASLIATVLLFTTITPALAQTQIAALGAKDSAVSADQSELKVNPGAGHYSGLEYAEEKNDTGKAVSDEAIQKSIDSATDDRIVSAVTNGSVRLSGKVNNEAAAKDLVAKVKAIPGVHEVTFDLGLEDANS